MIVGSVDPAMERLGVAATWCPLEASGSEGPRPWKSLEIDERRETASSWSLNKDAALLRPLPPRESSRAAAESPPALDIVPEPEPACAAERKLFVDGCRKLTDIGGRLDP